MGNVGLCLAAQNEDLDVATSYGGGGSVVRAGEPFQGKSEGRGDVAATWTRRGSGKTQRAKGLPSM